MGKNMKKQQALARYLQCEMDEITIGGSSYEHGKREYLVYTDEEAEFAAQDAILDTLWAFRPEFLADYAADGVGAEVFRIIADAKYEDANPIFLRLIRDLDSLVNDAIGSDGRGHFIAHYDGNEIELDGFYAYRVN